MKTGGRKSRRLKSPGPVLRASCARISMWRFICNDIWLQNFCTRAPVYIRHATKNLSQSFRRSYPPSFVILLLLLFFFFFILFFCFYFWLTDTREMRSIASSENLFQCASVLKLDFFLLSSHFGWRKRELSRFDSPRILHRSDDISWVLKVNYIIENFLTLFVFNFLFF